MKWRKNDFKASATEAETRDGEVTLQDPEDRASSCRSLSGFETLMEFVCWVVNVL